MIFTYGKTKLKIPEGYEYVYYATFIAGEWDFLKVKDTDTVLDAGAFIGDFTVKIARKAKEVVAVEPLPWAFKLLKENVEINNLKNVVLVNKALYDVDGVRLKIVDEGTGSKIGENGVEVEGVTVDSLGKFSVVKMDIEGAEGKVMKNGEWLDHVKQIAIELHGRENIEAIPQLLRNKGFVIRFMTGNDLLKNALKNSFLHPISFIKAETRTKVILNYFKRKYDVPALSREEYKILYGRK
ncbi:FkbM family methyltransferase [Acidianus ambivalens]|uniref:FkbM family methyltransferase n=1 Tax=Acidianus ambivalens TaxID=2283 RepID=A0A650CTC4_ACIAM|nr:FkbM family methyltransferase [Acidianus ambivalens]MQL56471.1 FkbM family methyltransferase [Acidianus ambivalens]QGR21104.1 FkbM family methyltransferase [Acidianus ambivalens]